MSHGCGFVGFEFEASVVCGKPRGDRVYLKIRQVTGYYNKPQFWTVP